MPKTIISSPIRFRYEEVYRQFQLLKYPQAVKQGGFLSTQFPDTRTANGLTMFVIKFLTYAGHRATRIASSGRMIGRKYIPGTTRKGTADISATIRGRAVMIEIKVGKDKPSEYQLREQELERNSGGVYEFIHTPEEFILWYDAFLLTL
jgi:hypothetical protein